MRCKFPDRDLVARLENTICRYMGDPVLVNYHSVGKLSLSKIHGRKTDPILVDSTDPNLDISTVPMGYCQVDAKTVFYVSRRPVRRWKQGIDDEGIAWRDTRNQPVRGGLMTKAVEDMIVGRYPDLEVALKNFENKEEMTETAISREVALKFDPKRHLVYVHFKGDEVGWLHLGTRIVIIPSKEDGWIVSMYLRGFGWEVR